MQSSGYLQVCFPKLSCQFQEELTLDSPTYPSTQLFQAIRDLQQWSLQDVPRLRTQRIVCRIFWKQSSLAHKTPNQLTASPKPTTRVTTELHSSGTAFLPIPCPGNNLPCFKVSTGELRRNKRHRDTKHTYGALGSSHQAWDICGFLRMPACSSN